MLAAVGTRVVVVIGRNEGERLVRVLRSALEEKPLAVVYVDSGSSDGSLARAAALSGVVALGLDSSRPFTPARGRNEGFRRALELAPGVDYVQFLDGDCVLVAGFTERAARFLDEHADVGLVAGRLREELREKNYYHRLADMEWDTPTGEVESTGGICMVRASVFAAAGGFDGSVAAGEELELARRLRAAGLRIMRLPDDMALHDIKMEHFRQWWTRARRFGHATAESLYMYGLEDRERRRQLAAMLAWGAALPATATALALPTLGASMLLLAGYPALFLKVRKSRLAHGDRPTDAALYAGAQVLAKFAGVAGALDFARRLTRGEVRHGDRLKGGGPATR